MQQVFLVESRSYDQTLRGSWQAYKIDDGMRLGDESTDDVLGGMGGALRLWLPAGTMMHWSTGSRPLRSNCLQFFWPDRWYMLSAFYNDRHLMHTYASIIQPASISIERLSYVDLELSILVEPDLSYEILTQVEFDQAADMLHYSEETRISALMALRTLTSSIQRSVGIFAAVPYQLQQTEFHLAHCGDK